MEERHLKILPVPSGIQRHLKWFGTDGFLRKTPRTFNRDGWYMVYGRNSWIELEGTAVEYEGIVEDFKRGLSILSAGELRPEQEAALRSIVATNLATPGQRKLYYLWEMWYSCRETGRSARKFILRRKTNE